MSFHIFGDTTGAGGKYSSDGINWTAFSMPVATMWSLVGKIGSTWYANGSGSTNFAYSTNGTTWTNQSLPVSITCFRGATNGTRLVLTSGSNAYWSTTGLTGSWTTVSLPNASGGQLCYGGGRFISVPSSAGTATSYSTDGGSTWTAGGALPANTASNDICWNGTVFSVLTSAGVATSTDGVTWTAHNPGGGSPWAIAAASKGPYAGTIVAVYSSATAYYTTNNGTSWATCSMPYNLLWRDVDFDEQTNLFCTFYYNNSATQAATSPDGITWTARTTNAVSNQCWKIGGVKTFGATYSVTASASATSSGSRSTIASVTYPITASASATSSGSATALKNTNGLLIVFPGIYGGSSVKTRYSVDGVNWAYGANLPTAADWTFIGEVAGKIIAVNAGGTTGCYTSTPNTGVYTIVSLPVSAGLMGTNMGGTLYSTFASAFQYTTNGTTWTSGSLPNASGGSVANNGTRLVTISNGSNLSSYSTNGTSWTAGGALVYTGTQNRICWNGTVFATTGSSGLNFSTNGITWTGYALSGAWGIAANRTTGTIVVTAGSGNTAYYSTNNGTSFLAATLPSSQIWRDVTFDDNIGLFVTFAYNNSATATSPDGINWTARTGVSDSNENWAIYGHKSVIFAGGATYSQSALATASSVLSFIRNINSTKSSTSTTSLSLSRHINSTKAASITSASTSIKVIEATKNTQAANTSTLTKEPKLTREATSTSTSTLIKAVDAIKSALSTTTANAVAIFVATTRYVTALASSTTNAVIDKTISLTHSATQSTTAAIRKVIDITKLLTQPSEANTSKAVLLNKYANVDNTSTLNKILYATKNVVSNSTSLLIKSVSTTNASISVSVVSKTSDITSIKEATSTSASSVSRAVSITKNLLVTSIASTRKIADITTQAIAATTATIKTVFHSASEALKEFYLTIRNAFSRKQVAVTVSSVIQLPGITKTTIRIN